MSANETDSIAYLLALKRSAPAPARDNTREPSAAVPEPDAPVGEKRRSPRYKCEGSAEIHEVGCDVRTWATFTDISLLGCYVEAQAIYPVGTVLQLKLTVNGIRVDVSGNVRVSYPYLGMGIAFVEVTEQNQARLREMLASIAPAAVIMGPGLASSVSGAASLDGLPVISDAQAAFQAIIDFFKERPLLVREDFLRLVRQSQLTRAR